MAEVFLSYKREDDEKAAKLVDALRGAGLDVWWDRDIPTSAPWEDSIERALHEAKAVIVCWSTASVASENVRAEARRARSNGKLIQLYLEPCEPPLFFGERQGIDLSRWNGHPADPSIAQIAEAVRRLGDGSATTEPSAPGVISASAMPQMRRDDPRRRSVAVLPFANLTGDAGKEYLADGMAEELILTLSRGSDLKVPSRTSTFAYKGRDTDIRHIARDLGVETVLEGSVRAAGDRIRITAQLIEADSGFHLWSDAYNRPMADLFELQEELARSIADGLKAHLVPQAPPTTDPDAFDMFLRALNLVQRPSEKTMSGALDLLGKAIERDPAFARAHALRAAIIVIGCDLNIFPRSRWAEARKAAEAALAIDASLPEAHAILIPAYCVGGDWLGAATEYAHYLDGSTDEPGAVTRAAVGLFAPVGKLGRGAALLDDAILSAPAWPMTRLMRGIMAEFQGDYREARRHLETTLSLGYPPDQDPASFVAGQIELAAGDWEKAVAREAPGLPPPMLEAGFEKVLAKIYEAACGGGDKDAAIEALDTFLATPGLEDLTADYTSSASHIMGWYVRLGAIDRAYDISERLIADWKRTGILDVISVLHLWRRVMRPFRDDARFQHFVERLNLFPCWAKYGPPDGYTVEGGQLRPVD